MNNGLETLKEIGAQTIHNETHISREYVQAMIHETFDGLQSVQFIGFVSILEREYNIDLSDLKAKGKLYFEEESEKVEKNKKIFVNPKRASKNTKTYILIGVVVLFLSSIYISSTNSELTTFDTTKNTVETSSIVENKSVIFEDANETNTTNIDDVKKKILEEVVEINATTVEKVIEEKAIPKNFKLLPKHKIWAGYINIETNQKYQKVFRKEFEFDVSKNWLLLVGPGTVKLEVNEERLQFSSKQNMRFKYVDGVFTKITVKEFKSLNKGRKW